MARILLLLVSLTALISLIFNARFVLEKQGARFKVIEVIDGDTFKIETDGGKRVRLVGVDAPELGRCLAQEAKDKLTGLVLGKQVRLADQFSDPYGRIMANVYVGGDYINKEMLAAGMGRMDYGENPRRDELKAAYAQAIAQKLGVHGPTCLVATSRCPIKGNVDSENRKLYYRPDCKGYGNVTVNTAFGDGWFCSEQEAVLAGFLSACQR